MITFYLQAGLLFRISIIAKFQLTLDCNFELHQCYVPFLSFSSILRESDVNTGSKNNLF